MKTLFINNDENRVLNVLPKRYRYKPQLGVLNIGQLHRYGSTRKTAIVTTNAGPQITESCLSGTVVNYYCLDEYKHIVTDLDLSKYGFKKVGISRWKRNEVLD